MREIQRYEGDVTLRRIMRLALNLGIERENWDMLHIVAEDGWVILLYDDPPDHDPE